MDRRKFLGTTAAGGALLTMGLPGCGNHVTPAPLTEAKVRRAPSEPSALPAATLNDIKDAKGYGTVQLQVPYYPDLDQVGGAITIRLPVDANDQNRGYEIPPDNTILLVQRGAGDFAAFQSSCPHAGCPLGYALHNDRVECPCHSSRFLVRDSPMDPSQCAGAVTRRPARAGLQSWKVTFDPPQRLVTIDLQQPLSCNNTFPPLMGTMLVLPLADFPQLAQVGGSVSGLPMGATDPLVVVRVDETTVAALNARCTHQGCPVHYNATKMTLDCPCHGSDFALDGSVLQPPATQRLQSYAATLELDRVTVTVL